MDSSNYDRSNHGPFRSLESVSTVAAGKRRGGPTLRSEGEYGRESITILLIALTLALAGGGGAGPARNKVAQPAADFLHCSTQVRRPPQNSYPSRGAATQLSPGRKPGVNELYGELSPGGTTETETWLMSPQGEHSRDSRPSQIAQTAGNGSASAREIKQPRPRCKSGGRLDSL